jgi:hypothetical protein
MVVAIMSLALVSAQFGAKSARAADTPLPGTAQAKAALTLPGVWSEILQRRQDMANLIDTRKLANVETPALQIANLAHRLPGLSGTLPADKLAALKRFIPQVLQLANDLDSTGDGGDLAGTNAKKLDEVLQSIAALYPEGALPKSAPPASSTTTR